jgi:hypothetical protein
MKGNFCLQKLIFCKTLFLNFYRNVIVDIILLVNLDFKIDRRLFLINYKNLRIFFVELLHFFKFFEHVPNFTIFACLYNLSYYI